MFNEILLGGGTAIVSGVIGFFISKKLTSANFEIYTQQAQAKANAIEHEAQILLERAQLRANGIIHEAQKEFESAKARAKADLNKREDELIRKEESFTRFKQNEEQKLQQQSSGIQALKVNLQRNESSLVALKLKYEKKIDEALHAIEHCAGMTQDEAKTVLLEKVEEKIGRASCRERV
jgi:ribonuclease Y